MREGGSGGASDCCCDCDSLGGTDGVSNVIFFEGMFENISRGSSLSFSVTTLSIEGSTKFLHIKKISSCTDVTTLLYLRH